MMASLWEERMEWFWRNGFGDVFEGYVNVYVLEYILMNRMICVKME